MKKSLVTLKKSEKLNKEKSLNVLEKTWTTQRKLVSFLLGGMVSLALAILFYRSLFGLLISWPVIMLVYLKNRKKNLEKASKLMSMECLDALRAVESSLRAGESLKRAFLSAEGEIEKLWGRESILLSVWKTMNIRIELREVPEKAFAGMAEVTGLYELSELSELLAVAGKSGSSQSELLSIFCNHMYEKLTVEGEIQGKLTERRMEKNIMLAMPSGILLYLTITSYEWISVLYTSVQGRIFMTGCFIIYAIAYVLGERFLKIKV